eukprot:snap_masked-scaffold_1-processed-gene-26.21-mRNA-1 protein AED:1.00 eAED:1.00 QI:0/0/0/0/1/1/2/0/71
MTTVPTIKFGIACGEWTMVEMKKNLNAVGMITEVLHRFYLLLKSLFKVKSQYTSLELINRAHNELNGVICC